jgi:hypothetical protein
MATEGVVQILVAVIGATGGPVVAWLLQRKRTGDTLGGSSTEVRAVDIDHRSQTLSELALYLLCGAIFCILLSDSILISGRAPALSISTLLGPLAAALAISGGIYIGWRNRHGELVIGILALCTAIVLLLSPGGPFVPSEELGGEQGLSLLVPLFVLATMIATAIFRTWGTPFTGRLARRSAISIAFTVVALVPAISVGRQWIQEVADDPRNPIHGLNDAALAHVTQHLDKLREFEPAARAAVYRLGSEAVLAPAYAKQYFSVRPALEELEAQAKSASTQQQVPAATDGHASAPPTGKHVDQADGEPTAQAGASIAQIRLQRRDQRLETLLDAQRQHGAKAVLYLSDRTRWIHPAGNGLTGERIDWPLPQITVAKRYEQLSELRIVHALGRRSDQIRDLRSVFEYPYSVLSHFSSDLTKLQDDDPDSLNVYESLNAYDRPDNFSSRHRSDLSTSARPWDVLFPEMPSRDYSARLEEQLALPNEQEGYLAYSLYAELAQQYQPEGPVKDLLEEYWGIPATAKQAVLKYIAGSADWHERLDVLDTVSFIPTALDRFATLSQKPYGLLQLADAVDAEKRTDTGEVTKLASDIVGSLRDPNRDGKFVALLRSAEPDVPVLGLFTEPVMKWVHKVRESLRDDQRKDLVELIASPVSRMVPELSQGLPDDLRAKVKSELESFTKLTPEEQESLLHFQAIATYRPHGPYALSPINLLFVRAGVLSPSLALVLAAAIVFPAFVVPLFLGAYLARLVLARDRLRGLIEAEKLRGYEQNHQIGEPTELVGRTPLLLRLRRLASRGWSTIAVVGRRGVGKSRVLYRIYQEAILAGAATMRDAQPRPGEIGVWISAPSRFDEEEFVVSALERLALATEGAVSDALGAQPHAVRRLENKLAKASGVAFGFGVLAMLMLLAVINERTTDRSETRLALLPAGLLLVVALGSIVYRFSQLQPVNLVPWLERDRAQSAQTVLLYRRVNEALAFIATRGYRLERKNWSGAFQFVRVLLMAIGGAAVVFASFVALDRGGMSDQTAVIFACGGAALAAGMLLRSSTTAVSTGSGLMSLVAEYRDFASTLVYRLRAGALGAKSDLARVVVCVDELDKIVDLEEIRQFLRRIKAIFEIPGIYYYLSLAEDSLQQLYLGGAAGKTEVDSSLDHIVVVEPLDLANGASIASDYLKKKGLENVPARAAELISALSFGVSRDVLRRCDELLAAGVMANDLERYASGIRSSSAEVAHNGGLLSKESYEELRGPVKSAISAAARMAEAAHRLSGQSLSVLSGETNRIVLQLWTMSLLEVAIAIDSEAKWRGICEDLSNVGYLIPVRNPLEVVELLTELSQRLNCGTEQTSIVPAPNVLSIMGG